MTCKHGAHVECGRNREILLFALPTSISKRQMPDWPSLTIIIIKICIAPVFNPALGVLQTVPNN